MRALVDALERIVTDYGDVWGGSRCNPRTLDVTLICTYCNEAAPRDGSYFDIKHDEECAVSIAGAALKERRASSLVDDEALVEKLADQHFESFGWRVKPMYPTRAAMPDKIRDAWTADARAFLRLIDEHLGRGQR